MAFQPDIDQAGWQAVSSVGRPAPGILQSRSRCEGLVVQVHCRDQRFREVRRVVLPIGRRVAEQREFGSVLQCGKQPAQIRLQRIGRVARAPMKSAMARCEAVALAGSCGVSGARCTARGPYALSTNFSAALA